MRKLLIVIALATAMSGCGILYKQPIYQGNLIDKAAADQLQAGMTKEQVQAPAGHAVDRRPVPSDRWDYAASERTVATGHVEVKDLTLWFDGNTLTKWEGQYFPEQDEALVKRMSRFGNLPKEKDKKKHQ